ncbi:MAG TPA: PUA domain-containing protein [Geobacterales bacterium]|nr:PUA domain-containing protein [Geobacterales bacterium]
MEQIKKKYSLSSSDVRELIQKANKQGFLSKQKYERVEVLELKENEKIILFEGMPLLIEINSLLIPTLVNANIKGLPSFKVDEGAIPHILNGADIMVPGIIEYPKEIKEGMIATVKSIKEDFLAIAKVLESPMEKINAKKGKLLKNLHHKNDKYYELCISILKKLYKK